MTEEQHKEMHVELHKKLDELLADYIRNAEGSADNTIWELIQWSYKQTQNPDHGTSN